MFSISQRVNKQINDLLSEEKASRQEEITQMHLKVEVLQQELEKREITLLNLSEEKENLDMMVENFRSSHTEESEMVSTLRHENENMKVVFAEKEATMKDNFANKVGIGDIQTMGIPYFRSLIWFLITNELFLLFMVFFLKKIDVIIFEYG